jgi:preprotein translocase subunit YajC
MEAILPLLAMFGLMWVLLIRPQQRRVRQHQAVVSALKEGDEVITSGGLYGTVVEVEGDTILVEVSPEVIVRVLTGSISQRLVPPSEGADGAADGDSDSDAGASAEDNANEPTAAITDGSSSRADTGAPGDNGRKADQASKPGASGGDDQQ